MFLQARRPRLVEYAGDLELKLPVGYEGIEDAEEKAAVRNRVEKSIVLWTYDAETRDSNPVLHDMARVAQARNRRDTVDFSANTWDGDIIPFRQCLIRIARYVDLYTVHSRQGKTLT